MAKKTSKKKQKIAIFPSKSEKSFESFKNLEPDPITPPVLPGPKKRSTFQRVKAAIVASKAYTALVSARYWLFSHQAVLDEFAIAEGRSSGQLMLPVQPPSRFQNLVAWARDVLLNGILLAVPVSFFFGAEFGVVSFIAIGLGHFMFFDILAQTVRTIKSER
ncbi:MAG: hypothetical protein WCW93_03830 [Candidatus Paceibacterota bacterium]